MLKKHFDKAQCDILFQSIYLPLLALVYNHYCSKPFYISPLWGFNTFVYSIYYQYFAPELNLVPEGRYLGKNKNRIMFKNSIGVTCYMNLACFEHVLFLTSAFSKFKINYILHHYENIKSTR